MIQSLPKSTVNLISSGQIVPSISAVVKELVENSLDAPGVTEIDVKLEGFGLDKIEVTDNGSGVRPEDIPLMPLAHTTSKISEFKDLDKLTTFGFRGEALHALANVSDLSISSKTASEKCGVKFDFDSDGKVLSQCKLPMNQGTKVSAQNLFQRLPVRRNMYSKTASRKHEELRRIEHYIRAFGLVKPQVRISLSHDRLPVFQKKAVLSLAQSVDICLGIPNLSEIGVDSEFVKGHLFFPPVQELERLSKASSSDRTMVFINDRPVELKPLLKMIKKLMAAIIGKEKHPMCAMVLTVAPDQIDANLDPNKQSVFLRHQERFLESIELRLKSHFKIDQDEGYGKDDKDENLESSIMEAVIHEPQICQDEPLGQSFYLDQSITNDKENQNKPAQDLQTETRKAKQSKVQEKVTSEDGAIILDEWSKGAIHNKNTSEVFNPVSILTGATKERCVDTGSTTINQLQRVYKDGSQAKQKTLDSWTSLVRSSGSILSYCTSTQKEDTETQAMASPIQAPEKRLFQAPPRIPVSEALEERQERKLLSNELLRSESKRKQTTENNAPASSKRAKTSKKPTDIGNHTLRKLAAPSGTPNAKAKIKVSRRITSVQFAMSHLSDQTVTSRLDKPLKLVGRLQSSPYWLFMHNGNLFLLNQFRAQEVQLYQKLMCSYSVPISPLTSPLSIPNEYDTMLKSLRRNSKGHIEDQRLVKNGFGVSQTVEGFQVSGICKDISNFVGVGDVMEVLDALANDPNVSLEKCRPLKIQTFFRAEAVRLARQASKLDELEIGRLLAGIISQSHAIGKCLHEKPLAEMICQVPLPQHQ